MLTRRPDLAPLRGAGAGITGRHIGEAVHVLPRAESAAGALQRDNPSGKDPTIASDGGSPVYLGWIACGAHGEQDDTDVRVGVRCQSRTSEPTKERTKILP